MAGEDHVLWFEAIGAGDVGRVGGKNASLGEMIRHLRGEGVTVPDGFATTAAAYRDYVAVNRIEPKLRARLKALAAGRVTLQEAGADIRQLFLEGEFPDGPRAGDPRRVPGAVPARGRPHGRRRGAQQRHRGGPAAGELRRAAGKLP